MGDVLESVLIILQNFLIEDVVDIAGNVRPEVPGNEHSPFFIEDV